MANSDQVNANAKAACLTALANAPPSQYQQLKARADEVRCFYCMDLEVVYKERGGMFANLDGKGNFDMIKCVVCTGEEDAWLKCMHDPDRECPGILLRERRSRMWGESTMASLGESCLNSLQFQIGVRT